MQGHCFCLADHDQCTVSPDQEGDHNPLKAGPKYEGDIPTPKYEMTEPPPKYEDQMTEPPPKYEGEMTALPPKDEGMMDSNEWIDSNEMMDSKEMPYETKPDVKEGDKYKSNTEDDALLDQLGTGPDAGQPKYEADELKPEGEANTPEPEEDKPEEENSSPKYNQGVLQAGEVGL